MNKTIYISIFLSLSSITSFAQVAMGKTNVNGTQTILDFEDSSSNTKGIILPAVSTLPTVSATTTANGTFLFDKNDFRIKVKENGSWKILSDTGSGTNLVTNSSAETSGKAIIGSNASNANGVLVLESTNKAVIFPKIANPHSSVQNPYPGMICYDTVSKSLAVFDGTRWSYWK